MKKKVPESINVHKTVLTLFAIVLVVSLIIVGVVLATQKELPHTIATSPQAPTPTIQSTATGSFSEDFSSDTFKDAPNTNIDWNTSESTAHLPTGPGDWYEADGTTLGNENVSMTTATLPDIAVDSNGDAHMVWEEGGFIVHAKHDSASDTWVDMGGNNIQDAGCTAPAFTSCPHYKVNGGVSGSLAPELALDSQDNPNVVWIGSTDSGIPFETLDTFFGRWDPQLSDWVDADGNDLDDAGCVSPSYSGCPLANISQNQYNTLHVDVDVDQTTNEPIVMWADQTPDTGNGPRDILVATWSGSQWTDLAGNSIRDAGCVETAYASCSEYLLTKMGGTVFDPRMALDSQQNPHIVFFLGGELDYAKWDGSTWTDITNHPLSDASCIDGSYVTCPDFNVTGSGNSPAVPDISLDSNDIPGLAFRATGGSSSHFARWSGSAWTDADGNALLGADGLVGSGFTFGPQVEFDNEDNPLVLWDAGGEIFDATWDASGTLWTDLAGNDAFDAGCVSPTWASCPVYNVTNNAGYSYRQALATDVFGYSHAAWYDLTGGADVWYSRWVEPCTLQSSGTAQSLTIDSTTDNIGSATLTVNDNTFGDSSIAYALSNDGGTTFENVTPGVSHTFASSGSDLRWRATLTKGSSQSACPLINNVSVTYSSGDPVVRIPGDTPREIAINVSEKAYPASGSAPVAVLGRDDQLIDEFVSTPLVALTNATLLLAPTSGLHPDVLTELQRVLTANGKVYLLGGVEALSEQVVSDLTAAGFTNQERLGGAKRYETAVEIYKEIQSLNPEATTKAYLVEADYLVDAFAISPEAGNLTKNSGIVRPILLTGRGNPNLYPATQSHITSEQQTLTQVELIGGPVAIPQAVQDQLAADFSALNVTRVSGQTRYHTNQAINDLYFASPATILVANGQGSRVPGSLSPSSVDATSSGGSGLFTALLAGAWASKFPAPLVLTETSNLPSPSQTYIQDHAGTITQAFIIGSELDVSETIKDLVASLL